MSQIKYTYSDLRPLIRQLRRLARALDDTQRAIGELTESEYPKRAGRGGARTGNGTSLPRAPRDDPPRSD